MRKLNAIIFFLVQLAFLPVAFCQSLTAPIVNVRNLDTGAITSTVIHNGDTLYLSLLPKDYTTDFNFGVAPGHTVEAYFSVDGQTQTGCFSAPYIPNGRKALVLAAGKPHTVAVFVNKAQVASLTFNLANAPPTVTTPPATKPVTVVAAQTTVICPVNGGNATVWVPAASGRTLENIIYDSTDGQGFIGNVRGDKVTISNIDMRNLNEGFHYTGCSNLTIIGGGQVGNVLGRCHLFEDVINLTWTGDPAKVFGHASTQSPIRFDSPGVRGGTITGVYVTQVGSSFPIACWAIHAANAVKFVNCTANGGQFSFNSAGSGAGDAVVNCTVTNITCINTQISVTSVASNDTFTGGTVTYSGGECVSISGGMGNVFDGMQLHSTKHGFHFYVACNAIIKNCTVYGPKGTPIMDGACTSANDGGGNKLVITP